MKFKVGDLVKIVRDPPGFVGYLTGTTGFIDETSNESSKVSVTALNAAGKNMGGGWIPSDCLELCDTPETRRAKKLYNENEYMDLLQLQCEHRSACWQAKIQELATRYGITDHAVETIYNELGRDDLWNS